MEERELFGQVLEKLELTGKDISTAKAADDLAWVICTRDSLPCGFDRLCRLKIGDSYSPLCGWHYDRLYAKGMFNRRTYLDRSGRRRFRAKVTAIFSKRLEIKGER